jgi:hypothetical protein
MPTVYGRDFQTLKGILDRSAGFGHRQHIELAWTYLGHYDIDVASEAMAGAIRHVAALHGAPGKYHETLTRAWVHVVALHRAASAAESFDDFVAENPRLLDRHLLDRHYSRELIMSREARVRWTAPDLRDLPALP